VLQAAAINKANQFEFQFVISISIRLNTRALN